MTDIKELLSLVAQSPRADSDLAKAALERIVELEKKALRYEWLASLPCNALYLTRDDDHSSNYMSASEWIDSNPEMYEDTESAEIENMKSSNTIWGLRVYPDTPIGFYSWYGASMDAVLDAAIAAQSKEQG